MAFEFIDSKKEFELVTIWCLYLLLVKNTNKGAILVYTFRLLFSFI